MPKALKNLLIIPILTFILFVAWMIFFAYTPIQLKEQKNDFNLRVGSSVRSVCQQLVHQGIIYEPWSYEILVRLTGKSSSIQAGVYEVESGITPLELIDKMTNGDARQVSITFIEGWTFSQMRSALNQNESIKHLTMPYTNLQILEQIGAKETNPEGIFFPDTYYFSPNTSDKDILRRAYKTMQTKLKIAWENRAKGLPFDTPYQALILASIVEKETGRSVERPKIAGVFVNRLRIGMRLQTDPTVIYGLGDRFDGNLRKIDLITDTPFNTYTRAGLPPTPIAMPGLRSIEASLHPEATKAIYFVGKGDGTHVFSATLTEHNLAVTKYQLRR